MQPAVPGADIDPPRANGRVESVPDPFAILWFHFGVPVAASRAVSILFSPPTKKRLPSVATFEGERPAAVLSQRGLPVAASRPRMRPFAFRQTVPCATAAVPRIGPPVSRFQRWCPVAISTA